MPIWTYYLDEFRLISDYDLNYTINELIGIAIKATRDSGKWDRQRRRLLYHDKSRARRVIDVPSMYVANGEVVRVRIIEAGMPKAQNT